MYLNFICTIIRFFAGSLQNGARIATGDEFNSSGYTEHRGHGVNYFRRDNKFGMQSPLITH